MQETHILLLSRLSAGVTCLNLDGNQLGNDGAAHLATGLKVGETCNV
jgi:hypothetical protein